MRDVLPPVRNFLFLAFGVCAGLTASAADDMAIPERSLHLEVGTFCATSPYGITMLVDRGAAFLIAPEFDGTNSRFGGSNDMATLPYGTQAPDGTYFSVTGKHAGAKVVFTWGKLNDRTVGAVITTDKAVTMPIHLPQLWSGCKTVYWKEKEGVAGTGIAGNIGEMVGIHVHAEPAPTELVARYGWEATMTFALDPSKPTVIVATIEDVAAPAFDTVAPALEAAGEAYEAHRIAAEGDWGNYAAPIADAMNGSRLFSSVDRRIAHVVGRGWWIFNQGSVNGNPDLGPYFGWDSFFNGNLASLEDPAAARDTVRAVLSLETPEGMIGNFSHWPANYEYVSVERTDPPVGALCVWKMQQRWPDKAFLKEIYPRLVKWHDWFHIKRAKPGDFLLSWGSGKGDIGDARLETGWDDTQSFGGGRMVGNLLNEYNVDLNSLWAMDAENLAHIADAIGRHEDAEHFRGEHTRMIKEMNDRLWNEKLGLYCNRMWEDNSDGSPQFVTRITPMNFYPLICGAPDKERAKRVLGYLHDPKKFWGDYLVPTLPYDDPDFHQQDYWHGHTWAPVNYLLWQGLVRYDDAEHLAEFARRSVSLYMNGWNTENRYCSENYRSDTGKPDDDPHYTWGALLPLIGIEALFDITPDLKPVPRKLGLKENLVLRRIPVGGKLYRIESRGGEVSIAEESGGGE